MSINKEDLEETEELEEELTDIAELGYLVATISAFGHTFKLKTLNTFEKVWIAKEVSKYPGQLVFNYAYPREVIAFSLIEFDGEEFKGLSSDETKAIIERANTVKKTIDKWDFNIVAYLFSIYSELAKEEDKVIEELKKKAKILSPQFLSSNSNTEEDSGAGQAGL
jgi:hypothetical protein